MSVEPTSEQLKIINDHGKHYSDGNLAKLLGVSSDLVPLYRDHYRLLKGKKVHVPAPDEDLDCLVDEMKALIKICEVTDNMVVRKAAKDRLKTLSQIPEDNEYGMNSITIIGLDGRSKEK